MHRSLRVDRALVCMRSKASPSSSRFLCATCGHAARYTTSARRAAGEPAPHPADRFSKMLERNLWKKDPVPEPAQKQSRKADTVGSAAENTEELDDSEVDSYVPAEDGSNLEEVGGIGSWWKTDRPQIEFSGYLPAEKVSDPMELAAALHRVVVEVFALQQVDWPLSMLGRGGVGEDVTRGVQIVPSGSGSGAELRFPEGLSREELLQALMQNSNPTESEEDITADRSTEDVLGEELGVDETAEHVAPTESEEDVAADRSTVDPLKDEPEIIDETAVHENPTESEEDVAADRSNVKLSQLESSYDNEYENTIASYDPIWLNISLDNPDVKFAVVKRVMQLTGIRIPDSDIRSSDTVSAILSHLVTPPKPRKLIEALSQNDDLLNLANVKIYNRRVTPIDREVSVGRWKLIEKELKARNLPVTGH